MSDGAKIIVLPTGYDPEGDEAVVTQPRKPYDACRHEAVSIDEDAHRLVCRRCDAEVDPLQWIGQLAADWRHYEFRIEAARRRAKDAEQAAERAVADAKRQRERERKGLPMPIGRRLTSIGRQLGRAQASIGDAFGQLARVHESGHAGLADSCMRGAIARSSLAKLQRDHGRPG